MCSPLRYSREARLMGLFAAITSVLPQCKRRFVVQPWLTKSTNMLLRILFVIVLLPTSVLQLYRPAPLSSEVGSWHWFRLHPPAHEAEWDRCKYRSWFVHSGTPNMTHPEITHAFLLASRLYESACDTGRPLIIKGAWCESIFFWRSYANPAMMVKKRNPKAEKTKTEIIRLGLFTPKIIIEDNRTGK